MAENNSEKDNNAELERLAADELIKEAKTLAKIAKVEGALGWKKRRILRTNKIFLHQTLKRTVNANKMKNTIKK
ncbi:unnamed protein product [Nezara viridula]|uniref:Uncharacterized protein n=1 Tax=Nezara viridula TaxID=85310 RepID=A0A9P0HFI0_NEZVI|nr:unnamed protein product [Nezara viridula]